jgi:hypothetical protein
MRLFNMKVPKSLDTDKSKYSLNKDKHQIARYLNINRESVFLAAGITAFVKKKTTFPF